MLLGVLEFRALAQCQSNPLKAALLLLWSQLSFSTCLFTRPRRGWPMKLKIDPNIWRQTRSQKGQSLQQGLCAQSLHLAPDLPLGRGSWRARWGCGAVDAPGGRARAPELWHEFSGRPVWEVVFVHPVALRLVTLRHHDASDWSLNRARP